MPTDLRPLFLVVSESVASLEHLSSDERSEAIQLSRTIPHLQNQMRNTSAQIGKLKAELDRADTTLHEIEAELEQAKARFHDLTQLKWSPELAGDL